MQCKCRAMEIWGRTDAFLLLWTVNKEISILKYEFPNIKRIGNLLNKHLQMAKSVYYQCCISIYQVLKSVLRERWDLNQIFIEWIDYFQSADLDGSERKYKMDIINTWSEECRLAPLLSEQDWYKSPNNTDLVRKCPWEEELACECSSA